MFIYFLFCIIFAKEFSFSEVRRAKQGYIEIEGPPLTPLKNMDLIVVGQDGVVDHVIQLNGAQTNKRGLLLLKNPSRPEFGESFIGDEPCTFLIVKDVQLYKGQSLDPSQSGYLALEEGKVLDSLCVANDDEVGYECYSEMKIGTRKGLKKTKKEKLGITGKLKSSL